MDDELTKVRVDLGARGYDVLIGQDALARGASGIAALTPRKNLFVITDETVSALHLDHVRATFTAHGITLNVLSIPEGEAQKSFAGAQKVCDFLLDGEIERSDIIIALGGGVVGDLTGFASAITKRGTRFIQIPTTLLSQVDSSVGGKTGINTAHGKNLVGAFHQPALVIADTGFLRTLPTRQMRAGYAEIIKYAALADADFFTWLDAHSAAIMARTEPYLSQAIARAIAGKARIVEEDEKERGRRALLNLGHSFGHALEGQAGYDGALLHGEAVAAGIGLAFSYAEELGLCPTTAREKITAHLRKLDLPTGLSDVPGGPYTAQKMMSIMQNDKKNKGGVLRLVLPDAIGRTHVYAEKDLSRLRRFLDRQMDDHS